MAELRQTSFAAGELAPLLCGRTDLPQYDHGLRRCHNFVIDQHGAAVFRPGLQYIATCASGTNVKLFALNVSEDESYLLVFTANAVRIHPGGGSSFTEIRTPFMYTDADVPRLRFQQLGRGVLVFCPGHPVYEIRGSGASWSITTFSANPQFTAASAGLEPIWAYLGPLGKTPTEIMRKSDGSFSEPRAADNKYRYVFAYSVIYYHPASGTYVETTPTNITLHGDPYNSRFAAQRNEAGNLVWPQGNPWEAAGIPIFERIDPDNFPLRQIYLIKNPNYSPPPGYEHHAIRFYRGIVGFTGNSRPGFRDGSVWGLVAETLEDPTQKDIVVEFNYLSDPDYTIPPRYTLSDLYDFRRTTPVVLHYPTVGALHDQRLVFAASQRAPDKIWFSQVNSFDNFDVYPIPAPHHALTAMLGGSKLEQIVALVSHHKLLVFTDTNLWALDGGDGGPIATGNLVARISAEVGAAPIQPLVLGSEVFFVAADRRRIFRAFYDGRSQVYETEEVSIHSAHLFRQGSRNIRAWTLSREPSATVWVARADGRFVSFTYTPATGVMAFAEHETGRRGDQVDRILDFATLRVDGEDQVYAVVRRLVGSSWANYLERLDATYSLDGYKIYARTIPTDRTITLSDLHHLNGRDVYVVTRFVDLALGPFRVENGQITFTVPSQLGEAPGWVTFAVGLPYVGELELLDAPVEKLRVKTISKVGWEVVGSRGLLTGEDFDHLAEWIQPTVADIYVPVPGTGLVEVYISSSWNKHGRAVLRQPLPLPLTVIGITREGKLGG